MSRRALGYVVGESIVVKVGERRRRAFVRDAWVRNFFCPRQLMFLGMLDPVRAARKRFIDGDGPAAVDLARVVERERGLAGLVPRDVQRGPIQTPRLLLVQGGPAALLRRPPYGRLQRPLVAQRRLHRHGRRSFLRNNKIHISQEWGFFLRRPRCTRSARRSTRRSTLSSNSSRLTAPSSSSTLSAPGGPRRNASSASLLFLHFLEEEEDTKTRLPSPGCRWCRATCTCTCI